MTDLSTFSGQASIYHPAARPSAKTNTDSSWGSDHNAQRRRNWERAKTAAHRRMVALDIPRIPKVKPPKAIVNKTDHPQSAVARDWLYVASPKVDYIPESPVDRVKIIIQQVCKKHGVTIDEIKGNQRATYIVVARQEACYALKTGTTLSLPRIGQFLGGKDHTTVLHSVRKHKERMAAAEAAAVPGAMLVAAE